MKPHKHAEIIKAWADGAKIQYYNGVYWTDDNEPAWYENARYRVKMKHKSAGQVLYEAVYPLEKLPGWEEVGSCGRADWDKAAKQFLDKWAENEAQVR